MAEIYAMEDSGQTFYINNWSISLISDQATITAARILNILIFGYHFYFLSKTFRRKYLWVSLVTFYSLPGVGI